MIIITYEDRYRDDLIFMILEAKNALGSIGYRSIDGTDEVWLHRLFVKYNRKYEDIGHDEKGM